VIPALAHDPITTQLTFSNEISRLLNRHCTGCHQDGGQAMPLMTYQQVRPWAKAIRDEVLARRMPPWDAVKGVGEFRNDTSLSAPEMDMVVRWVEGGAPEGDTVLTAPKAAVGSTFTACGEAPPGLSISGDSTLPRDLRLTGIWTAGPGEVTAMLPDGGVQRLLWVRNFHARWNQIYWLREPCLLPTGTRLFVRAARGGSVRLLTTAAPAR
jgi:hypothetical protein